MAMSQREFIIHQLVKDCKLSQEVIDKVDDITNKLNEFFESEILVPHPELGFSEMFGFLRRGHIKYDTKNRSAEAFQRDSWPTTIRDDITRFSWILAYETAPDYVSSGQTKIGWILSDSEEKPFFIGASHGIAKKNNKVFASVDETIEFLREYLPTCGYKKR